jgi:hypothetical protein
MGGGKIFFISKGRGCGMTWFELCGDRGILIWPPARDYGVLHDVLVQICDQVVIRIVFLENFSQWRTRIIRDERERFRIEI